MNELEVKNKYIRLREVYLKMVGNLYPSIVYKELMALRKQYTKIVHNPSEPYWGDLPTVYSPDEQGYVR